jgi:hypothetical protein
MHLEMKNCFIESTGTDMTKLIKTLKNLNQQNKKIFELMLDVDKDPQVIVEEKV